MLKSLTEPVFRGNLKAVGALCQRFYGTNPIEYRTKEQLQGAATGGGGGRGSKGRKRGPGKTEIRKFKVVKLGEGRKSVRWGGLSYPLGEVKKTNTEYGWLNKKEMGIKQESDLTHDEFVDNSIAFSALEGNRSDTRMLSDMYWGRKGWTSGTRNGQYVGCPELPDGSKCVGCSELSIPNGTPMKDFSSFILELKRVATMKTGGRKKTVSALVVVGNKNGAVGYAVGKGELVNAAIRKAKNKAINYLQFIPRYQDYTIYHNIKVKYCRTNLHMERRIKGTGLSCHRIVTTICKLAGIKDARAKIIGSTNPLNVVRATMKGLTSQQTLQSLADKSDKFVVEYSRENYYRPMVVAVPKSQDTPELKTQLAAMQLL